MRWRTTECSVEELKEMREAGEVILLTAKLCSKLQKEYTVVDLGQQYDENVFQNILYSHKEVQRDTASILVDSFQTDASIQL